MLLYCSTHNYSNIYTHKEISQAIKTTVAFHSDILGAVILRWILPVLSFYMLYMSYSNLNKHKAWLAINNPSVISWTRYLVRPLS